VILSMASKWDQPVAVDSRPLMCRGIPIPSQVVLSRRPQQQGAHPGISDECNSRARLRGRQGWSLLRLPGCGERAIYHLGRGVSDTPVWRWLAALEGGTSARLYDVDGVYTTDPRVVRGARTLDNVTFEELLEMASCGSKVLRFPFSEFAGKEQCGRLRSLHSFKEGPGTLFPSRKVLQWNTVISGIAFQP